LRSVDHARFVACMASELLWGALKLDPKHSFAPAARGRHERA
jgi:hypothetical protein